MPLTREQLREQLKRREIAPVYTLFGEETYLRDAAAKYIADLCFGEGELREFNEDEYSLNTPDNLRSALAAAEQLPMMAAKRVIRVTDVRVAATSNRDSLKEEFEPILAAYRATEDALPRRARWPSPSSATPLAPCTTPAAGTPRPRGGSWP